MHVNISFENTNKGKRAYLLVHFDKNCSNASLYKLEPVKYFSIEIPKDAKKVMLRSVAAYQTVYGQDASMYEGCAIVNIVDLQDGHEITRPL